MADYLDLTGLNHGEQNTLQSNGGVGSLLGSTMPYGAIPFALAGNMPASSWANSAATMLGAPIDAMKWAARQAGIQNNLNGAPIADVPGGSDTWRSIFGSLSGPPTPTQQPQPPPPPPRPIASPFGVFPSNNGPTPPQPQPQQQPQDPSQSNPGEVAGFLGTPVDAASAFLRMVGLSAPKDAPFGSASWQRMLDHYNQANRPSPPLTWDDIITAARRPR
jgi:hypothetical protein